MKKVDLHVHSKYSPTPSEWFLRHVGMNECYTDIDSVYRMAKSNGMDFVTITDHNTVDGVIKLNQRYPDDTFTGVEITTGFPEDGCKMHVLLYDMTAEQYAHIEQIRSNIYHVRDYITRHNIPHSVAHATYAVNNRLSMDVWEKLILMFDVFEGINGCRNPYFNYSWMEGLRNLSPQKIDQLYNKHQIEPMSEDPWVKGFTGGSDDHAGLFIGKTYTVGAAQSKEDFLQALRDKKTLAMGRNNNYKGSAFIFYKIIQDHRETRESSQRNQLLDMINNIVYKDKGLSLKESYGIQRMKIGRKKKERLLARFVDRLEQDIHHSEEETSMEDRINVVYDHLCTLCDEYIKMVVKKTSKDLSKGDMFKSLSKLTSLMPVAYFTVPFIATWGHLNKDRLLLEEFRSQYLKKSDTKPEAVCWFTDTLLDLNGVSVTINNMHRAARNYDLPLVIVTSNPKLPASEIPNQNIINLPTKYEHTSEFYSDYTMNVPSLLKSLEAIERVDPKEIVISTPGPLGLIGYLIAKILGIPCTGIYHSDFGAQLNCIMGDGYSPMLVSKYNNWFYNLMDTIRVPTHAYIDILKQRGMDASKMKVFKRGIDMESFNHEATDVDEVKNKYNIQPGFNLIYAGRVSKDKNLKFLADVYKKVSTTHPDTNLIIAGRGPYLEELKAELADYPRVIFTDQITRFELAQLYSLSDLLVFPSTTDTFGMVVLEAHSCGVPAFVSDQGGPQEIVQGATGEVLSTDNPIIWIKKITEYIELHSQRPADYLQMRTSARELVEQHFTMKAALADLLSLSTDKMVDISQTPKEEVPDALRRRQEMIIPTE